MPLHPCPHPRQLPRSVARPALGLPSHRHLPAGRCGAGRVPAALDMKLILSAMGPAPTPASRTPAHRPVKRIPRSPDHPPPPTGQSMAASARPEGTPASMSPGSAGPSGGSADCYTHATRNDAQTNQICTRRRLYNDPADMQNGRDPARQMRLRLITDRRGASVGHRPTTRWRGGRAGPCRARIAAIDCRRGGRSLSWDGGGRSIS